MRETNQAAENTDREIWRECEGDFYSDALFVTAEGALGINRGGHVIVMPVQDWFRLAEELPDWDDLLGRAPDATGALSSEDFVRKLRDEWAER